MGFIHSLLNIFKSKSTGYVKIDVSGIRMEHLVKTDSTDIHGPINVKEFNPKPFLTGLSGDLSDFTFNYKSLNSKEGKKV